MKRLITFTSAALLLFGLAHGTLAQTAKQPVDKKQDEQNRKNALQLAAQKKQDEQRQEAKKKIEAQHKLNAQAQEADKNMAALRKQDELHCPVKGQHPLLPKHPRIW